MKYVFLLFCVFSIIGCSDTDAKREAAAEAAFEAAYNHCIQNLKRGSGECEAYMERNWEQFYIEPK